MDPWRERWTATVAGDVADRDGLGWEFTHAGSREVGWEVFREDSGPFPVLSAVCGSGPPPEPRDRTAMTRAAVDDLLAAVGLADPVGWSAGNLTAALALAGGSVDAWEGLEWAVESTAGDRPVHWAGPTAARTPYAWLRASTPEGDHVVGTHQDDDVFGLAVDHGPEPHLPDADDRSLRPHRSLSLLTGAIDRVVVAYDSTAGGPTRGLLAEILLQGPRGATLLVAAEAYDRDDWRRYDESVVVLPDPSLADTLAWRPPRAPWPFGSAPR